MHVREVLLLIGVALTATHAQAQTAPELPKPRPIAPAQSLPELPTPRPVPIKPPPLPPMARLALESNYYQPVCEPEPPTTGLWGIAPTAHARSWQECWMGFRDCLAWICTRPTCCAGMQPSSDASLYDWLYHRLWPHKESTAAPHAAVPQTAAPRFAAPRVMPAASN